MDNIKKVSLSWLVVSTRDYKFQNDWFWDKIHHCCFGIPKDERTDNAAADLAKHYNKLNETEEFYQGCVLMPELQELDILEAASFLRDWCTDNQVPYSDDLDQYEMIERGYHGYAEDGEWDEKLFFCMGY